MLMKWVEYVMIQLPNKHETRYLGSFSSEYGTIIAKLGNIRVLWHLKISKNLLKSHLSVSHDLNTWYQLFKTEKSRKRTEECIKQLINMNEKE